VDGEKSRSVKVKSGVPQGTVLDPLMFLLYINDIGEKIGSSVRLFADDSLIYMAVSSRNDCQRLQDDLTTMVNWSKKWQMIFNPSKCYTLRITKGKQPVIYPYYMEGQVLESVNNNPYLGVELSHWQYPHKGQQIFGIYTAKFRQMSHKYQATSLPQPCKTAP
jgi:hypothetical protein